MKATIHVKTRQNNFYLYDMNNKELLYVHPVIFELSKFMVNENEVISIEEIKNSTEKRYSIDEINYYKSKYLFLKKNGYFNEYNVKNRFVTSISESLVKDYIKSLNNIVFEVTDACNLKCKYCGYGEMYFDHDKREGKHLNISKTKKFMEFIISIVKFLNQYLKERKIFYRITTNGTLLKKNIKFLSENNFIISVSIDGNEKHNIYRTFHSGKNSFSVLLNNLVYLQENYPEYFEKNVSFLTVLHDKNSIKEVNDFLYSTFKKNSRFSPLDNAGINPNKYLEFIEMYKDISKEIVDVGRTINLDFLKDDPLGFSLALFMFERLAPINFEKYEDLNSKNIKLLLPGGSCLPFEKKLFLTVNGKILVCERINQEYVMGTWNDYGFSLDEKYISSFYSNIYERLVKQCSVCYKAEYCKQCFFQIDNLLDNYCPSFSNKIDFEKYISYYINLLENNKQLYPEIINKILIK